MELGVFEHVPPQGSATVKELAQKAQCEEELISRLDLHLAMDMKLT